MLPAINNRKVKPRKRIQSFGVGKPFNPLTFDSANLLALYDGDFGLSNLQWVDQTGANHIVLFNIPTVVPNAVNGHQAVRFDGVNQYGAVGTPNLNQPITTYLVLRQISYTAGEYVIDGDTVINTRALIQNPASPNLRSFAGAVLDSNPDLAVGTYGIITTIYNGANSEIRTNDSVAVMGNVGAANSVGIRIASRGAGAGAFSNIETAFYVVRQGADSTATQNLFINYFKNRFAI